MSDIDYGAYAKATTPAFDPGLHDVSMEAEAQAKARRIREIPNPSERQFNVSKLHGEVLTCKRNLESGYPDAAPRLALLERTLALVGSWW